MLRRSTLFWIRIVLSSESLVPQLRRKDHIDLTPGPSPKPACPGRQGEGAIPDIDTLSWKIFLQKIFQNVPVRCQNLRFMVLSFRLASFEANATMN